MEMELWRITSSRTTIWFNPRGRSRRPILLHSTVLFQSESTGIERIHRRYPICSHFEVSEIQRPDSVSVNKGFRLWLYVRMTAHIVSRPCGYTFALWVHLVGTCVPTEHNLWQQYARSTDWPELWLVGAPSDLWVQCDFLTFLHMYEFSEIGPKINYKVCFLSSQRAAGEKIHYFMAVSYFFLHFSMFRNDFSKNLRIVYVWFWRFRNTYVWIHTYNYMYEKSHWCRDTPYMYC